MLLIPGKKSICNLAFSEAAQVSLPKHAQNCVISNFLPDLGKLCSPPLNLMGELLIDFVDYGVLRRN